LEQNCLVKGGKGLAWGVPHGKSARVSNGVIPRRGGGKKKKVRRDCQKSNTKRKEALGSSQLKEVRNENPGGAVIPSLN